MLTLSFIFLVVGLTRVTSESEILLAVTAKQSLPKNSLQILLNNQNNDTATPTTTYEYSFPDESNSTVEGTTTIREVFPIFYSENFTVNTIEQSQTNPADMQSTAKVTSTITTSSPKSEESEFQQKKYPREIFKDLNFTTRASKVETKTSLSSVKNRTTGKAEQTFIKHSGAKVIFSLRAKPLIDVTETSQSSTIQGTDFVADNEITTTEDPVEKQINDVINSLPKLPELILSDHKTHIKFKKNPIETLLDERISQVAREMAEISLRKEYEEQKLAVTASSTLPNPQITKANLKTEMTTEDTEITSNKVSTEAKSIPQYIYKSTLNKNMIFPNTIYLTPEADLDAGVNHERVVDLSNYLTINKSEEKINKVLHVEGPTSRRSFSEYSTTVSDITSPILVTKEEFTDDMDKTLFHQRNTSTNVSSTTVNYTKIKAS